MEKQTINCDFQYYRIKNVNVIYSVIVEGKTIIDNAELKFVFKHHGSRKNRDVKAVIFKNCVISKVPQGLTKVFPNLNLLTIYDSKLKSIEHDDLKEYSNLSYLYCDFNDIEYLPNDLLFNMTNLEVVSFEYNKIQKIGPNIFDGLHKLKCVSLRDNLCIDKHWDTLFGMVGNATLDEIKDEIYQKFKEAPTKSKKRRNKKQKCEPGMLSVLKNVLANEQFKDFTIKVENEEFKVHKMILAARSTVFAEMFENNVNAECLELIDMPKEIFHQILNFIYTDELPKTANVNYRHLFAATGRLKIEELKNFAAEKLIEEIKIENALEMLNLAIKYASDDLKQKTFEVIKENVKEVKFINEMANQPEKLKKILEMKKKKERLMKEMEELSEEFKLLCR